MFLKRIELKGFKSFADKTELEFVPGITAVVGPNGSGKSNISDSIRWVLGEQSAKSLRGGKMEDIIFAGSDTRKAVNYGEVTLTLDNTTGSLPLEYQEVSVTRRILRSGESEYYINKQSCRLKDITELFMDTGIGKESYSIIGQGRIEEILSTRSEERRGIFEEASGIVKYKSRKKQAQKKLEDTEQNLVRIGDLIAELEGQVEPLRDQSEKAKQYKQLKGQLKAKEISLYVHQIDQVHEAWSETRQKLESLQDKQIELSTVVSQHDAHLETFRLEIRRLEEQLELEQAQLMEVLGEAEKCDGQGEVLKERNRNLANNHTQYIEKESELEIKAANKQSERNVLQDRVRSIQHDLSALQQKLKEEEDRLLGVTGGAGTQLEEDLRAELLDVLNTSAQQRNEMRYLEQQLDTLAKREDKLDQESEQFSRQSQEAEAKQAELHKESQQVLQLIEEARAKWQSLKETIQLAESRLETAVAENRSIEQKIDGLTSRRDTLREMKDDFDGFMHGVKAVLKARSRSSLRGIHGAVAELVQVPAKYETAIEIALGGALQNVVMDNEASAREAIQYLKRQQLGRATFLPLDVIRGRSLSANEKRSIEQLGGFIGIAVDLISFEERYRDIAANLLGHVIIAESLEDANRIAATCHYRFRVVTLTGDVVNPGGSMTGGSVQKKTSSLLGRQREIEELTAEIARLTNHLTQAKETTVGIKNEIEQCAIALEQQRAVGEQLRLKEQEVRSASVSIEQTLRNFASVLQTAALEKNSLRQEQEEMKQRKQESEQHLSELACTETSLNDQIREAELARKSQESAKDELQSHLTDLKVQIAAISQDRSSLQDQIKRTDEELQAIDREKQANQEQISTISAEMEQTTQDMEKQSLLLTQLLSKKRECSEKIDFMRADRADWIKRLETEENETKEQRVQLRQVEEQLHQQEVRVNRQDVELDNLLKKLAEDYELGYELAKERYPVPEDIIGTQAVVRDMKRQISLLGEVNLGAIDEYERVKERFDFLSSQKNDLMDAKQTLYQVIAELDEQMAQKFAVTFEQIRGHFRNVFVKLFGGGRADLVLNDPTHILETGVDIVAQPPGKKLQNLQLLSGGEKALTAIALLFAIIHVRPVPFCVLDEVEAALDEANVSRFAAYLREFAQETQFIVVTHRKGTMEEADVLYGVTMEEDGVSKLVSVRLEEGEPVSA